MSDDGKVLRFPILRPQAFVQLTQEALDEPLDPDGLIAGPDPEALFQRNSFAIRVSREDAIAFGLVEPTPAEAAKMKADTARWLAESLANRAKPGPELTLEALLAHLDLSAEYAAHLLHPECSCDPFDRDGTYVCPWARELGFEEEEARRARS